VMTFQSYLPATTVIYVSAGLSVPSVSQKKRLIHEAFVTGEN